MTTTNMFCTVDDVRGYLRTEAGWTEDNSLMQAQIIQATTLIRAYTRRDWEKANYVDYFNTFEIDVAIRQGTGFAKFSTREKPISILTGEYPTVKFNTGGDWENTGDIPTTLYDVDTRLGQIIFYPIKMRSYGRSLRVSYFAGFPVDDTDPNLLLVSANLKQACIAQAAYQVRRILNDLLGNSRDGQASRTAHRKLTASGFVQEALVFLTPETRLFVGSNA